MKLPSFLRFFGLLILACLFSSCESSTSVYFPRSTSGGGTTRHYYVDPGPGASGRSEGGSIVGGSSGYDQGFSPVQ